jgi:hypothetical protein
MMAGKSMKLGGGGRFQSLKEKIAARGNVSDPAAVAASIGRKKYGKAKFQKMASKGKARAKGKKASGLPPWLVTPKGAGG